jgi:uncharacterized protein (DUF2267 family)
MSATGLDVFDKTLQTTNSWLDEFSEALGPDRKLAWKVLSVVLHKLRDRMPVELAAHLGAELPLLVRGAYYDSRGIHASSHSVVAEFALFRWRNDAFLGALPISAGAASSH